ncbi:MAG: hypothetical protein ACREQY_21690, partial [Candidatus Binatia bacterium]
MAEQGARKIVINGKEYATVEEMPPEIRAVYDKAMALLADKDANDVPDILEGKGPGIWEAAKQVWGIAKEARQGGIRSVELRGGLLGSGPAASAEPRRTTPAAPRRIDPAAVGGFSIRKLLFAIIAAAALTFA